MVKQTLKSLVVLFIIIFTPILYADVTYLYDATGNVVAVVDPSDTSTNLYLASSGNAIGYVDPSNGAVYTYSGKHIGWYSDGVLWDNNGYILAYVEASRPKTITVPLVKRDIVINRTTVSPTVAIPSSQLVTTPPTYVYEVSPTSLGTIVTVEPAK